MKPSLEANASEEKVEDSEVKDILIQAGYGDQIDNVLSHVVMPIDYDVTIKGKKYSDLRIYTIALDTEDNYKKLLFVLISNRKDIVQVFLNESLIVDGGCRPKYESISIEVNKKNAIHRSHELSFKLDWYSNCGGAISDGLLYDSCFIDVDSSGVFKVVYEDILESSVTEFSVKSSRNVIVKVLDIRYVKNSKSDYNDIEIRLNNTVYGEMEPLVRPSEFMEYAFDSFDDMWSIINKVNKNIDGMYTCPKYTEESKKVLAFDGTKYVISGTQINVSSRYNNYCSLDFYGTEGLSSILGQLSLSKEYVELLNKNAVTTQVSYSKEDRDVLLFILPFMKVKEKNGKNVMVYDIHYVFAYSDNYKVIKSTLKREAFESPTKKSSEGNYSPTKNLDRVLVNTGYMNDMPGLEEYYNRVGRQRFYFSGDEYSVYDNLIYITEDYEIIDLTEPFKGVFTYGDELNNFGQLEEDNGRYSLKYSTKDGKEVKRPILRPDLLVKKGY